MSDFWDRELGDLDLDPTSFAERLAQHRDFCTITAAVALAWGELDAAHRSEAIRGLSTVALTALPEARTAADAQAVAKAIIEALRRAAAGAFAQGDLSEDSLREIIGGMLPQEARPARKPSGPRALPNPLAYYSDALTLPLSSWAAKWCPGMDLDQDYAALAERRRRARRTGRRRHLQNPHA